MAPCGSTVFLPGKLEWKSFLELLKRKNQIIHLFAHFIMHTFSWARHYIKLNDMQACLPTWSHRAKSCAPWYQIKQYPNWWGFQWEAFWFWIGQDVGCWEEPYHDSGYGNLRVCHCCFVIYNYLAVVMEMFDIHIQQEILNVRRFCSSCIKAVSFVGALNFYAAVVSGMWPLNMPTQVC